MENDLLNKLKSLKNIKPESRYVLSSKAEILGSRVPATSLFGTFVLTNSRVAFATVGLAGILIFGMIRFASPNEIAIDTSSLKAEAQAIDIQIELANINYSEIDYSENQTTPSGANITEKPKKTDKAESKEVSLDEDIEKALEELAE